MLKNLKKSELSKILIAKNCIENSKNCNNFHTGSKLERIIPNNTKNRGFRVSKSISPFFFDLHFCMTLPLRGR